jgi:hypothetical protein
VAYLFFLWEPSVPPRNHDFAQIIIFIIIIIIIIIIISIGIGLVLVTAGR